MHGKGELLKRPEPLPKCAHLWVSHSIKAGEFGRAAMFAWKSRSRHGARPLEDGNQASLIGEPFPHGIRPCVSRERDDVRY